MKLLKKVTFLKNLDLKGAFFLDLCHWCYLVNSSEWIGLYHRLALVLPHVPGVCWLIGFFLVVIGKVQVGTYALKSSHVWLYQENCNCKC